MRNIKLIIEYDGKEYNGWQKQPKIKGLNRISKSVKPVQNPSITTFQVFNYFLQVLKYV